jgi:TetR/AcrR family transcriptional regulator of autoinduction and epiphytic fitness
VPFGSETPAFDNGRYDQPVDPRIEHTRRVVTEAALALLGEVGYAAFTMEAVAARSGVAKSTVYRHWPTKIALVGDALETLNVQPRPTPGAGSVRDRVDVLLGHLARAFADSTLSACIPALIEAADHHPEVASFLHTYSTTRRRTLVALLREGTASGELPAHVDPELAALALSGAVVYCRTMTPAPLSPRRVHRLVDQVLGPRSA